MMFGSVVTENTEAPEAVTEETEEVVAEEVAILTGLILEIMVCNF